MMSDHLTRRLFTAGLASAAAGWPFTRALAAFEQKHALLIGIRAYAPAVGPLKNTINDIELIARALKVQSFEPAKIVQAKDKDVAKADQFLAAVDAYIERLRLAGPAALGFFYYCGHGVADPASRRNFLIPTGVASAQTPQLWAASVETAKLFERLAKHTGPQIVVLDCCRSELNLGTAPAPAPPPTAVAAATRPSTRPEGRGLVAVATHRRANMYVCHSASEGEVALDYVVSNDRNGPFAKALNASMRGLPARTTNDIFDQAYLDVREATNDHQAPAMLNHLNAAARRAKLFGDVVKILSGPPLTPRVRKDFALVVANSYAGSELELPHAKRDGALVARALAACGFVTELAHDLTHDGFFEKLTALRARLRAGAGAASVVLFFYGYGAGRPKGFVDGEEIRENFLLPAGVIPRRPADITGATWIAMTQVIATLVDSPARAIAILKDCNRKISGIGSRGNFDFGDMGRRLEQQHRNLLIVHADQPDRNAADDAQGSVFARVLADRLKRPERRSVQQVMNDVVADVFKRTGEEQKPWFDPANDVPMFFADETGLGRKS